MKIGFNYS